MKIGKINKDNLGLLLLLLGEAGVGKTTQVYSFPEKEVLFLNAENGIRAIQSWEGDLIDINCWNDIVVMATLIGGINENLSTTNKDLPYSKLFYENCIKQYPELAKQYDKYNYIYIDSITKLSFYCKQHAENIGLTGFKLWGFIADNMIGLFNQLRNSKKVIVCTGGQEYEKNEETGKKEYNYLLDGKSAKFSIKHTFDNVITLVNGDNILPIQTKFEKENPGKRDERREAKFFVCKENNQWGFLAKERSEGLLNVIEPANLCELINKINKPNAKPQFFTLNIPKGDCDGVKAMEQSNEVKNDK